MAVSTISYILISGICGVLLAFGLWFQTRIALGRVKRRYLVGLKYLSIILFFGIHWFVPGRLILDAIVWLSSAMACLLLAWLRTKWSK